MRATHQSSDTSVIFQKGTEAMAMGVRGFPGAERWPKLGGTEWWQKKPELGLEPSDQ